MALSILASSLKYQGAGYQPSNWASAATVDTTSANYVLAFVATSSVISNVPTVKFNGTTMAFLGKVVGSSNGTAWAFGLASPVATATGQVTMAGTSDYYGDGEIGVVTMSGAVSATFLKGISGSPAALTGTTAKAGGSIIAFAGGAYLTIIGLQTSSGGTASATQLAIENAGSNACGLIAGMPYSGVASAVAIAIGLPPGGNNGNTYQGLMVEMEGGGGTAPVTSTGTQSANLALTNGGEAGTVVTPVSSSTASLSLTSVDTGQVIVTGVQNASLALRAVESNSLEDAVLALTDNGTRFSIARTGSATYRDAANVLQLVAANGPRLQNVQGAPLGIMGEETSTNVIVDSMASSAVAAGAYPLHGSFYNGGLTGFTCVVVGTGVEDGVEYVDLRFQGSNSSGSVGYPSYQMTAPTDCPTTAGDLWCLSAFMRITAGTYLRSADSYPMIALGMNSYDSTGASYVASLAFNPPVLNSDKLTRDWLATSVPSGSSATVAPLLGLNIPAGATVDFTIRLGLPQLEKGKTRPTTAIKTNGAAAMRGTETVSYLTPTGTKDIQVEYVGVTGLFSEVTYAAQAVSGGAWPVPAVTDFPFVRRISSTATLAGRNKAVSSATAKGWNLGVAFKLSDYNGHSDYATIIRQQAAIYCPEYEFKMDQVQPTEGSFSYTVADNFAALATTDSKKLRGHALIWYAATPSWANSALTSTPTTARWQGIIDSHIAGVVNRWTQVTTWDVVNEAFEPNDLISGGYRNSPWYQGCGSAFIAYAFTRARAYNTTAKLHLAEYGLEEDDAFGAARRSAVLTWLTNAVNAGTPVHGLSLQCHLDIERPFSATTYLSFLNSVKALGLDIIVTEMDVRAPVNYNTIGYDLKAAERVRQVLDCITSVTHGNEIVLWDLTDTYTWLTAQFPSRTERPTPYDTSNAPKAMYAALQQEFETAAPTAYSGAVAPTTSTGTMVGNLALTRAEAGTVAVTGTETASLALTRVETGQAIVTGAETSSLALTAPALEYGTVRVTGTQTAALAETSTEAGSVPATGSMTSSFAFTSSENGQVSLTGSSTAAMAMSSADVGSVSVTGSGGVAGLALASGESGSATATGNGQGGLSLSAVQTSGAAATGSSSGTFAFTSAETGSSSVTGSQASALNLASVDAGGVEMRGNGAGSFSFGSSTETGTDLVTGTLSSGFNLTNPSDAKGTVSLTGSQSANLSLTDVGTGTAVVTGAMPTPTNLALASSQSGTLLVSGSESATLALTAAESASATPICFGTMAASLILSVTESGSVSLTGQSSSVVSLSAQESSTAGANGYMTGNLRVTSTETANVVPISFGSMSATFALTAADAGSVSLTGQGSGSIGLAANDNGAVPVMGQGAGGFALTGTGSSSTAVTGSSTGPLTLRSMDYGFVPATGQGSGSFGFADLSEAGMVLDAANQSALLTMTGSMSGFVVAGAAVCFGSFAFGSQYETGNVSLTGDGGMKMLALAGSGQGGVTAAGQSVASLTLAAVESSQQVASGTSQGAFSLSAVMSGTVAVAGQSAASLRLQASEAGSVSLTGSSASVIDLLDLSSAMVLVAGTGAGSMSMSAVELAGVLSPIGGSLNSAMALTSTMSAMAVSSGTLSSSAFRFGADGEGIVGTGGVATARFGFGMNGSGGVLVMGGEVSSWIFASFATSFSDNNIRGVGNMAFGAAMRGVVITVTPPTANLARSTERVVVVPAIEGGGSKTLSRIVKVRRF